MLFHSRTLLNFRLFTPNRARARKTPKVELFYSIETKEKKVSGELYNHTPA